MSRAVRHEPRVSNWVWGAVLVFVLAVGQLPRLHEGAPVRRRRLRAPRHASRMWRPLRSSSPVRIAGVNVGEVTEVEANGDAVDVTFTVDEDGQPIHEDAQLEIRPRLFLEGNFFLDLKPGSPSAPELPDGGDITIAQTTTAVQLDEVLTALQSDSREDLQLLLTGYGTALTYQPTPEDDRDQDEDVKGESASESLNDTFAYGGPAGRDTAIVNEALLGEKPHDLSKLIRAQRDTLAKLQGREADLQGLISQLQHDHGGARDRAGQCLRDLQGAGSDARAGRADASQAERLAAAAARAGA